VPNLEDIKLPPHSIETEKALLSTIFIDNEVMYNLDGYGIVPSDFYAKEHQIIYDAIHSLFLQRKTIDVVTVSDYLTKKKEIDNI
jgi:replicative DNA helicase